MWLYAAFVGAVPVGSPPERFHHSPSEYNGRLLRATNHEPRATIFSRAEGHSRRCIQFEFVAAKRHLSPRKGRGVLFVIKKYTIKTEWAVVEYRSGPHKAPFIGELAAKGGLRG